MKERGRWRRGDGKMEVGRGEDGGGERGIWKGLKRNYNLPSVASSEGVLDIKNCAEHTSKLSNDGLLVASLSLAWAAK